MEAEMDMEEKAQLSAALTAIERSLGIIVRIMAGDPDFRGDLVYGFSVAEHFAREQNDHEVEISLYRRMIADAQEAPPKGQFDANGERKPPS